MVHPSLSQHNLNNGSWGTKFPDPELTKLLVNSFLETITCCTCQEIDSLIITNSPLLVNQIDVPTTIKSETHLVMRIT